MLTFSFILPFDHFCAEEGGGRGRERRAMGIHSRARAGGARRRAPRGRGRTFFLPLDELAAAMAFCSLVFCSLGACRDQGGRGERAAAAGGVGSGCAYHGASFANTPNRARRRALRRTGDPGGSLAGPTARAVRPAP